jgi:hypothetical protein
MHPFLIALAVKYVIAVFAFISDRFIHARAVDKQIIAFNAFDEYIVFIRIYIEQAFRH